VTIVNVILVYNSDLIASCHFILNTHRMLYLENILTIFKPYALFREYIDDF